MAQPDVLSMCACLYLCVCEGVCVYVSVCVCVCVCNQFKQNMHMAAFQAAFDGIKLLKMFLN